MVLMVGGFAVMYFTGFFSQMALYNSGLAPDPNMQLGWLISKVGAITASFTLTAPREEATECITPMLVV